MEKKEQVKLVRSDTEQQYHILMNKELGRGGFGIVYEARALNDINRKLVVKSMKIDDQKKRKSIDKQLKIMSELPPHENIVSVIPLKILSANNYYIFMECCNGGTLYDVVKAKRSKNSFFEEEELYDIFYQCMNGYKVLYEKKILHQDIKPGNILIKNGVYKLADFGLSVFYQTHQYSNVREGTLTYIAPEKFQKQYVGNPKLDVYAFGVMFYEFITGHHPYVTGTKEKKLNNKQYILELIKAKLIYLNPLTPYSLRFEQFRELILNMVKKSQESRISFQQILAFTHTSQIFQNSRQKQKNITKTFFIEQYNFLITEITDVIVMPVDIKEEEEDIMRKDLEDQASKKRAKMVEMGKEVAGYFMEKRMIAYYIDRLTRKLSVQQLKAGKKSLQYERCIFYLTILTKSLLNDLVNEIKTPKHIKIQNLLAFKNTHTLANQIVSLLKRDHEYVEDSLYELLSQYSVVPKQETNLMFQLYKQHEQATIIKNLGIMLNQLLKSKIDFIEIGNKQHLITLSNTVTMISMLENLSKQVVDIEDLQKTDKKIIMSSTPQLIGYLEGELSSRGLLCGFDMTGVYDDDQLFTFETKIESDDEHQI